MEESIPVYFFVEEVDDCYAHMMAGFMIVPGRDVLSMIEPSIP
jgi:hypothetical protein